MLTAAAQNTRGRQVLHPLKPMTRRTPRPTVSMKGSPYGAALLRFGDQSRPQSLGSASSTDVPAGSRT